jgi:hypothetical protein
VWEIFKIKKKPEVGEELIAPGFKLVIDISLLPLYNVLLYMSI